MLLEGTYEKQSTCPLWHDLLSFFEINRTLLLLPIRLQEKSEKVDPPLKLLEEARQEEQVKNDEKPLVVELVTSKESLTPRILTKLAPYG